MKLGLERLSGYQAWLERSSDVGEIRALLRSLAPVLTEQPLVRIGGQDDGGYLLPDDLSGVKALISPGVSTEVSFDLAIADRSIDVFMADASVDGPPVENPRFHFHPKFVDVYEDDKNMRLDTLCGLQPAGEDGDRILQMDIEGAEYRVLLDLDEEILKSFRIMVIEFHHLDKMFASFPLDIIHATFQKLLRYHQVVHIHPNNVAEPTTRGDIIIPPIMEFTFYRKDRASVMKNQRQQFPHELDRDNVPGRPKLVLPRCWQ
ncbi:hypothetical protein AN191_13075 [Loktanella sp. 5RATIMAR09]|nr:hypothetical protein AN191_13075 [Loktanella sp. 5RATIMAR09]